MKDVILSYATNILYEDFARLVRSARAHVPAERADVIVITNAQSPRFAELAAELNVELVPAPPTVWKDIPSSRVLRILFRCLFTFFEVGERVGKPSRSWQVVHRTLTGIWSHPINGRHFAYLELLALRPDYRMVLLTDARDVVFQGDPFEPALDPGKLHAFLQDEALVYGPKNVDSDWYVSVYGNAGLAKVTGKPIACAGTIMGGTAVMHRLIEEMIGELVNHKRGSVDQAIYNSLLYGRMNPVVQFHPNLVSTVLTFGDVAEDRFTVVGDQVQVAGKVPAVLHQYDRSQPVREVMHRRFS
jgi:hypothetical protein